MFKFVHLHTHSYYSLNDALCSIDDLIEATKKQGGKYVALTDHGFMYGTYEFYTKVKEAGLIPIIGLEAYYTSRYAGSTELGSEERSHQYHLTILAKNNTGYRNLIQLASKAATIGQYYYPCIDYDLLKEHSEGLIILSGCMSGYISSMLLADDYDSARKMAVDLLDIFGEDFYLEIQHHPVLEWSPIPSVRKKQEEFVQGQAKIREGIKKLSKDLDIPMVATNDVHYINREDYELHDIMLAIRDKVKVFDEDRFRYSSDQFYFKTKEEMLELFPLDVVERSYEIAQKCNVTIDEIDNPQTLMPHFPKLPDGYTEEEYLRELAYEGLIRLGHGDKEEYWDRLEMELEVICRLGWPGYFLILWDIIKFCEENGIPRGTSRGSAGGSCVSWCLDITRVDPIEHGLLFGRFLNEYRVSLPDIDTDLSQDMRMQVVDYIAETYGEEYASQIGTVSLHKARAAIKSVATALSVDFGKANHLSSFVPDTETPIMDVLKVEEVANMYNSDAEIKRVIDIASQIQNNPSHVGIHPAGIIISPVPLVNIFPMRLNKGRIVTQWAMEQVESIGMLKVDILGSKTLDVIYDTLKSIEQNRGVKIDVASIPTDDPKTYELLGKGDTNGVFQLESTLARNYLRKMRPQNFTDVSNFVALIRPGPLDAPAPSGDGTMVDEFIRRLHGDSRVVYPHPATEDILKDTFGICLSGDTLVYNPELGRSIPIKDVKVGMKVQGVDKNNETAVSEVTNWVCNGYKDVLEIQIRDGSSIRATPDHLFLTENGWVKAGELKEGDYIATPYKLESMTSRVYGKDRLRILAYLIANGAISGATECGLVTNDQTIIRAYKESVRREFGCDILQFLRDSGLSRCDSHNKFVPLDIFECSNEEIAFFLACLWDCAGGTDGNHYYYKTTSKQLAYDIQHLLLRLGVPSVVSNLEHEDSWSVLVYHQSQFNETVGKYLLVKKTHLERSSKTTDTIDRNLVAESVNQLVEEEKITYRELEEKYQILKHHLYPEMVSKLPRISKDAIRGLVHKLPHLNKYMNIRWEPIRSITPKQKELVYDITVDQIHNFVANNMIVHNCTYQEQVMGITQVMAGFTESEADTFRRIIGNKRVDDIPEQRDKFVKGCLERGISQSDAEYVFSLLETFSLYGFNKCLSGDTAIYRVLSNQESFREITVSDLYKAWNSKGMAGRRYRSHGVPVLGLVDDRVRPVRITKIWKTGIKEVYEITTESGKSIKATLDHRFLTKSGGWLKLGYIVVGDILYSTDFNIIDEDKWDGSYPVFEDKIVAIEYVGEEETYDIEVETHHNFIANGIVTHNSHSVGYGALSMITAWLRANYYTEFMSSLLTSVRDNSKKLNLYLQDCHSHGVKVLPPSINVSTETFVADGDDIRFGLSAVKGVGDAALKAIFKERENGPFKSLEDFIYRAYGSAVNKTVVEAFILSGTFDIFGLTRAQMFSSVASIIKARNSYNGKIKRIEDKERTFVDIDDIAKLEKEREKLAERRIKAEETFKEQVESAIYGGDVEEFDATTLAMYEKELLGFYVTNHPLDEYKPYIDSLVQCPEQLVNSVTMEDYIGKRVITCGYISGISKGRTRYGRKLEFTIDDWNGTSTVIAYNKQAEAFSDMIKEGSIITVIGKVVHYPSSDFTYLQLLDADLPDKNPLPPKLMIYTEYEHLQEVIGQVDKIIKKDFDDVPLDIKEYKVGVFYTFMDEVKEHEMRWPVSEHDLNDVIDKIFEINGVFNVIPVS